MLEPKPKWGSFSLHFYYHRVAASQNISTAFFQFEKREMSSIFSGLVTNSWLSSAKNNISLFENDHRRFLRGAEKRGHEMMINLLPQLLTCSRFPSAVVGMAKRHFYLFIRYEWVKIIASFVLALEKHAAIPSWEAMIDVLIASNCVWDFRDEKVKISPWLFSLNNAMAEKTIF